MRGNEKQCQATGQRMSAAQLSSFAAARVAQKCQRIGFAQTRRGRRREGRQKPEWAALDRTLSAAHSAFCSSLRLCARCFHFTPQLVVFAAAGHIPANGTGVAGLNVAWVHGPAAVELLAVVAACVTFAAAVTGAGAACVLMR